MTPELPAKPDSKITVNGNDRPDELQEHDVVCEKGRGDHERWAGNRLYRFLINAHKETYNDLTPMERSGIIGEIIGTIKGKGGWFVQNDEALGKVVRLSEEKVRKKVSDDLRREVRRRREKRSSNSPFSAKLKALSKAVPKSDETQDLKKPVDDPRAADVLFGPGARRHPGNKIYWELMKRNLNQYIISPYGARSTISQSIVQGIRQLDGRFLEQDQKTSIWYEISDKRAIEKTSHALSNKKYKTRRRDDDKEDDPSTLKIEAEMDSNYDADATSMSSNGSDVENAPSVTTPSGSKKRRFLERMDEAPADDDITTDRGVLLLTSLNAVGSKPVKKTPAIPPATPKSQAKNLSMIITPNDARANGSVSSVSDESSYGDSQRSAKANPPPVVDAPEMHEYIYPRPAAEMGPRVAPRYGRYVEEEYYAHEHMMHKLPPSPYHRGRPEDYSPVYRRFQQGPPPSPAGYHFSPKAQRAPYPLPMSSPSRISHPSPYWASEYVSPPPARRGDEQKAWH